MSILSLDGNRFAEMILQGADHLSENAEMVNALNVFPVPDGDTGTNMNLSMTSGSKEAQKNKQDNFGRVSAAFAKGLLMGARGNSGVILSQLFRGFSKEVENKSLVTSSEFAEALKAGVDSAYRAVMKPVEGTILTVAKDAANQAVKISGHEDDLVAVMTATVEEANRSLKRTQEILPVLREVGVVDSGGQGLVCIYEGFLAALTGNQVRKIGSAPSLDELVHASHHQSVHGFMDTDDIRFGYCTEFMVRLEPEKRTFSEEAFRDDLSEYGDSLLVIADDEMAKVHIHSEQPGEVLTYGQQYGPLIHMKIENMREQHSALTGGAPETSAAGVPKNKQPYALISVSAGEGISELFKSIGVTQVIEGGQTMNPSTEDIMEAIEKAYAERVIILPNNKNIIMAAEQAAELAAEEVLVVPSKTIPQGMAAVLAFNGDAGLEQNSGNMTEAMEGVKSGQVTYAVRDTIIEGVEIKKDDFIGIADGKIVVSQKSPKEAAVALLDHLIDEDSEVLTVLYGAEADKGKVDEISELAEDKYPDVEVEVYHGGQPVYHYIFSVE